MEAVTEKMVAGMEEKAQSPSPAAKHPLGARVKGDGQKMSVAVARDEASLSGYLQAWEELAAEAIEPNPFYESWMLLPALRAFGAGRDLSFVLVFAPHP